jgi:hypothetical protein
MKSMRPVKALESQQRGRVLKAFVRQAVPLSKKVDPQHPLQPDRRAVTLVGRIVWPNCLQQAPLRRHVPHLSRKALTLRHALLAQAFRFCKPICRFIGVGLFRESLSTTSSASPAMTAELD